MTFAATLDDSHVLSLAELQSQLEKEEHRHSLLVSGYLRQCCEMDDNWPWMPVVVLFSRRMYENWEDPSHYILPRDLDESQRLRNAGNEYFKQKNVSMAIRKYNDALISHPNDHLCFTNLSLCLSNLGDWKKSANFARRAIEMEPNHTKAWIRLGQAYNALNQRIYACFCFRVAYLIVRNEVESMTMNDNDNENESTTMIITQWKKRLKNVKTTFRLSKKKLNKEECMKVEQMIKGQTKSHMQIMLDAFGEEKLKQIFVESDDEMKASEILEKDETYLRLKEKFVLMESGRVALASMIIPQLKTHMIGWAISWSSVDMKSHWTEERNQRKHDHFLDLKSKYGEKHAMKVCYPQYETYDDQCRHGKRAVALTMCVCDSGSITYNQTLFGVPKPHQIVNAIIHGFVAPMDGSNPCLPARLSIAYRTRYDFDEIKRLLYARLGGPKVILDQETKDAACLHSSANDTDPCGWNHLY